MPEAYLCCIAISVSLTAVALVVAFSFAEMFELAGVWQ